MADKKQLHQPDLKILWGRSGNCCAICKAPLVEVSTANDPVLIGEAAHIEGENKNSARYNEHMDDELRAAYGNRILLCPTDHSKIDKNEADYTVDGLHKIRNEHEEWVREALKAAMPNVTFAELQVVLQFISSVDVSGLMDLSLVHPEEKVKKNQLSPDVDRMIRLGISQAALVRDYINKNPDINFSGRIKSKFVEAYEALHREGLSGDEIFYSLLDFAAGNSRSMNTRTAALCVVAYFFEQCDIFEK